MLSLLAESWTWYAFACLVLITRYASRWIQLRSIKKFQIEDAVMLVVFGFYTTLIAVMNIVANLDTNLMTPDEISLLTPESIKSRIHGSKLVLVVEQSMICTTWGCKICLLLLYNKLTFGLKQQLAVKIIGGYVAFGFILMESLYFGVWCRPFNQYWAVPVANVQCSAAIHHLILNAVLNISSDVLMICIPLPLLITSKLPRAKKLILCCLFGLGGFVVMCAVLNKYYSFAHPFSPMWTFWYIREASCALYVANMPMCWPLMRRLFNLRAFHSSNKSGTHSHQIDVLVYPNTKKIYGHGLLSSSHPQSGGGATSWWERKGLERIESEEHIIMPPSMAKTPLQIWESKQFDMEDWRGSGHDDYKSRFAQQDVCDGSVQTKTVVSTIPLPPRSGGIKCYNSMSR